MRKLSPEISQPNCVLTVLKRSRMLVSWESSLDLCLTWQRARGCTPSACQTRTLLVTCRCLQEGRHWSLTPLVLFNPGHTWPGPTRGPTRGPTHGPTSGLWGIYGTGRSVACLYLAQITEGTLERLRRRCSCKWGRCHLWDNTEEPKPKWTNLKHLQWQAPLPTLP